MSKYTTTILCLVLLGHLVGYGGSTRANQESSSSLVNANFQTGLQNNNNANDNVKDHVSNDDNHEQNYLLDGQASNLRAPKARHLENIDLIELTPSLEQQLYQARRLNSGDPGSVVELASDAYRYDVAGESNQADNGHQMNTQGRLGRHWPDRVHMLNGIRRMSNGESKNNNDNYGKVPINNYGNEPQRRFSRGLAAAYTRTQASRMSREQDKDYGALVSMPSSAPLSSPTTIDNQESSSRKSLWTSELLRDLLIAQEARNRARFIEKLARAYEHEQGANQNSISVPGQDDAAGSNRRRCDADPNLGVKNPAFCDTDAYFRAADYTAGSVWDSAGR